MGSPKETHVDLWLKRASWVVAIATGLVALGRKLSLVANATNWSLLLSFMAGSVLAAAFSLAGKLALPYPEILGTIVAGLNWAALTLWWSHYLQNDFLVLLALAVSAPLWTAVALKALLSPTGTQ